MLISLFLNFVEFSYKNSSFSWTHFKGPASDFCAKGLQFTVLEHIHGFRLLKAQQD